MAASVHRETLSVDSDLFRRDSKLVVDDQQQTVQPVPFQYNSGSVASGCSSDR